jgi:isoleucyl-tRNA synthetase
VNPATGKQSEKRRAYRTVLDTLFHALVRYAAPIIPFTAEEVWKSRYPDADSVHMLEWPEVDAGWKDEGLGQKWSHLRELRNDVNEAIEPLRREKIVRSSLEADVGVRLKDALLVERANQEDFSEICITASARVTGYIDDDSVEIRQVSVQPTTHHKCGRCWRHLPEVTEDGELCGRCEDMLA